MRIYGKDSNGNWIVEQTDSSGFNDQVYVTALAQGLKLTLAESPFFANYGIPFQQNIVTQIAPDYYVAQMQSLYSQYFTSLNIGRTPNTNSPYNNPPVVSYDVNIVTHRGAIINTPIAT